MRQLYVSVRWAAAVVAVAATTGCMSIGDDGSGGPAPARSAGERSGAAAPDGGSVTPGGARGEPREDGRRGDDDKDAKGGKGEGKGGGKGGKKAAAERGKDAEPGKKPSTGGSGGGSSVTPTNDGGRPSPTRTRPGPRPTRPTPDPDPTSATPTPTPPEPSSPEPSSSAHGGVGEEAGRGEPSPQAGPA